MTVLTVVLVLVSALSFLMNCILFFIIIKAYMCKEEKDLTINKEAFASIPGGGQKRPQK